MVGTGARDEGAIWIEGHANMHYIRPTAGVRGKKVLNWLSRSRNTVMSAGCVYFVQPLDSVLRAVLLLIDQPRTNQIRDDSNDTRGYFEALLRERRPKPKSASVSARVATGPLHRSHFLMLANSSESEVLRVEVCSAFKE